MKFFTFKRIAIVLLIVSSSVIHAKIIDISVPEMPLCSVRENTVSIQDNTKDQITYLIKGVNNCYKEMDISSEIFISLIEHLASSYYSIGEINNSYRVYIEYFKKIKYEGLKFNNSILKAKVNFARQYSSNNELINAERILTELLDEEFVRDKIPSVEYLYVTKELIDVKIRSYEYGNALAMMEKVLQQISVTYDLSKLNFSNENLSPYSIENVWRDLMEFKILILEGLNDTNVLNAEEELFLTAYKNYSTGHGDFLFTKGNSAKPSQPLRQANR